MGRPPCCDKVGIKKGPWNPEEDIVLVSYIQEHGPGNWRSIPTNTGLVRCSKSCRLRWTNYLRPGIKRGNFTEKEEKMIIHLQALLGNRWAAIASYLPQRTDNDIKNYWNTHLKKNLKKLHESGVEGNNSNYKDWFSGTTQVVSKGQWEKRLQTDIHVAKQALCEALSLDKPSNNNLATNVENSNVLISKDQYHSNSTRINTNILHQASTYAASAGNIARLLENWLKSSPKSKTTTYQAAQNTTNDDHQAFDSLFSFSSPTSTTNGNSQSVSVETANLTPETSLFQGESKPNVEGDHHVPLTLLEKWLLDDVAVLQDHEEDLINMSLDDQDSVYDCL